MRPRSATRSGTIEAAWSGARGALSGTFIGGIANAIRGVFGPGEAFRPVADAFQDQQRALNDRIDLLADVSGYCNLVMSKTWTLNGNALNGYARAMPFDTQIGPNKNAARSTDCSTDRVISGTAFSSKLLGRGGWTLRSLPMRSRSEAGAVVPERMEQGHADCVLGEAFRHGHSREQAVEHDLSHGRGSP
ncbi:hypothetical protein GS883_16555 [Rhodococcus hoagii]|nr:hypothetical protein [Prescottella equi]